MRQKTLSLLVSFLTLCGVAMAQQNWPERPIVIIAPNAPGGLSDTLARALADGLSTQLGQSVVVENRSGASGTIGLQATLRTPADGYTYVIGNPSAVISSQFTFKDLPFNMQRDFQAVAGVAFAELVMSVSAAVPARNPQELIAWFKGQTGNFAYGSYGEGTYAHAATYRLATLHGFNAVHVPYKGEQPMLMALASNDIVYGIGTLSSGKTMQDTGKTRMIGMLSAKRSALYPDLPTFKEVGVDDPAFQLLGWYGLFTHKSVPQAIVKRMETAVRAVLNTPTMQQRLKTVSVSPWDATAKELQTTWYGEIPLYYNLLRAAGVQLYE